MVPPYEESDPPYDVKLVFVQKITFVLKKISKKLLPPELHFLTPVYTKSFVGCGFAPDPTGGAYSAPPDPLAVFRGLLLKGRESGRGGEGEKRKEEREGREFVLCLRSGRIKKSRRLWINNIVSGLWQAVSLAGCLLHAVRSFNSQLSTVFSYISARFLCARFDLGLSLIRSVQ